MKYRIEYFFKKNNEKINYIIFMFFGIFIAVIVYYFININIEKKQIKRENFKEELLKRKDKIKEEKIKEKNKIFENLDIEAKSFMIFDLENNQEIFSKNKNKKSGIASLTKIATADVYLDLIKKDLNQIQKIKILKENIKTEGVNGLSENEIFDGVDLIKFMLIVSANDAASTLTNEIGEEKFLKKMNLLAEKLNLNSTLFFSISGLDINDNIAGSYSSAEDIVFLTKYFFKKYKNLSKEISVKEKKICSNFGCHKLENTNKLFFEEEKYLYEILFSKTGFTERTGGSLVMISKIFQKNILIVVLSSGKNERFTDMKKLFQATEKFLKI